MKPSFFLAEITVLFLFLFSLDQGSVQADDSHNPQDWFDQATEDLESAEVLFATNARYATVCFHAHQTAEKSLKGELLNHIFFIQRTHDLKELLTKAVIYRPELKPLGENAEILDSFYETSRYPKPGVKFARHDASQCLESGRAVYEAVVERELTPA